VSLRRGDWDISATHADGDMTLDVNVAGGGLKILLKPRLLNASCIHHISSSRERAYLDASLGVRTCVGGTWEERVRGRNVHVGGTYTWEERARGRNVHVGGTCTWEERARGDSLECQRCFYWYRCNDLT
jgi:hypothetical protein